MWQPTHVKVTVKQAKGVLTKGKNGTNDAFVVIGIGKEKYQTSIKEKSSSSVEWREECELAIPSQGNKAIIQLTVYHHNALGLDEFLGQISLPLNDFDVYEKPKYRSYKLKGKPEKDKKKGEKERGELEIMINFVVKSGSFLDISKKEKQKSSLTSLKHLGGSLMSIGGKDKREGLKNFAKSVSSKMDKIAKPKRRKSKTPSEVSSTGFSNDLMSSQQRYGDADPGVISDDDDDDFKFDDDVKVNTRTSSPLSTMSRGSSLMHDQVLDTDETKEAKSAPLSLGRQATTAQKVTSFSNPNPLVRIPPLAPEIAEAIIEEEPSFEKDLVEEESIDDVKPVSKIGDDFVDDYGDDDEDDYEKLGSIDLGPPIQLPNRILRKQDAPSSISISDEVVNLKTKDISSGKSNEVDKSRHSSYYSPADKQDTPSPISTFKVEDLRTKDFKSTGSSNEVDISRSSPYYSPTYKQDVPSAMSTSDEVVDMKTMENFISSGKGIEVDKSHTSSYYSPTEKQDVSSSISASDKAVDIKPRKIMSSEKVSEVDKSFTSTYSKTDIEDVYNQKVQNTESPKYKFEINNSVRYIELKTAKSDIVETKDNKYSPSNEKAFEKIYSNNNKYSPSNENAFEKIYSNNKSSPPSEIRDELVNVGEKIQGSLDGSKELSPGDKNVNQRNDISDELKPKILDESNSQNRETREGRDSAISLTHDPDSIISSRPRSSSNASSVISSVSTSSAYVDKDVKDPQLRQASTVYSVEDSPKPLLKSSSDLDVLLRRKSSTDRRDGKRVVSAVDSISSGDLEENQIVRSGSLTERRPSAIAAAVAASADRDISTPGTPPIRMDEWERKLYGRTGITGSVDNVSMTGSRSSLNTSRESSIHDVKKGDSFTRLPEVKALTLEKISINEEDEGKQKKRKHKTPFKNRFFSKPDNRDRPNEDSRIVEGGNDRLPSIPSRPSKLPQEIHDKFAGKSREDLLEIILNLQSTLEKQVKHSSELEEYIDNLLLRVMEATPHILQAPITPISPVKYDAKLLGFF